MDQPSPKPFIGKISQSAAKGVVRMAGTCGTCACHANMYTPCDVPGGCGSIGCGRDTKPGGCVTCSVFRPDADPRVPNYPPVCDGDRTLMDRHLVDIANLHADLSNGEGPLVDDRTHERFGVAYLKGDQRHVFSRGLFPSDPVAALGGVAPINSRSKQPSVSGSREKQIPISADTHDLKAAARVPNPTRDPGTGAPLHQHLVPAVRYTGRIQTVVTKFDGTEVTQRIRERETVRDAAGQIVMTPVSDAMGYLSAATTLDQWVRDWRDTLFPDHHLPAATVDELVMWLRNRLQDACDQHPAIDEFAAEMKALRGALRSAAGVNEQQPERCDGIPCRRCDLITLYRAAGDVSCINPDCQAVMREDEYLDWVNTLAAEQRVKRKMSAA